MNWSNDKCPVCNNTAREALPRMGDFAEFICDDCGRYRVSGTVLEIFRHKDKATRQSSLEVAKRRVEAGDKIPMITSDM